ncbi:hypothetical protein NEFER03_0570 [Nematocida sp. LUAm3]|nr:hypothetical protein NEFER03_0570 [Nematocida sp. LUAm3]KAI5175537.1 hypothetical protein NEFER02_1443 [Nematocida sp. LUAm2]KAI5178433.1 hypothetical protein NEFER01_1580 [Nematocida sp. LUAm1]
MRETFYEEEHVNKLEKKIEDAQSDIQSIYKKLVVNKKNSDKGKDESYEWVGYTDHEMFLKREQIDSEDIHKNYTDIFMLDRGKLSELNDISMQKNTSDNAKQIRSDLMVYVEQGLENLSLDDIINSASDDNPGLRYLVSMGVDSDPKLTEAKIFFPYKKTRPLESNPHKFKAIDSVIKDLLKTRIPEKSSHLHMTRDKYKLLSDYDKKLLMRLISREEDVVKNGMVDMGAIFLYTGTSDQAALLKNIVMDTLTNKHLYFLLMEEKKEDLLQKKNEIKKALLMNNKYFYMRVRTYFNTLADVKNIYDDTKMYTLYKTMPDKKEFFAAYRDLKKLRQVITNKKPVRSTLASGHSLFAETPSAKNAILRHYGTADATDLTNDQILDSLMTHALSIDKDLEALDVKMRRIATLRDEIIATEQRINELEESLYPIITPDINIKKIFTKVDRNTNANPNANQPPVQPITTPPLDKEADKTKLKDLKKTLKDKHDGIKYLYAREDSTQNSSKTMEVTRRYWNRMVERVVRFFSPTRLAGQNIYNSGENANRTDRLLSSIYSGYKTEDEMYKADTGVHYLHRGFRSIDEKIESLGLFVKDDQSTKDKMVGKFQLFLNTIKQRPSEVLKNSESYKKKSIIGIFNSLIFLSGVIFVLMGIMVFADTTISKISYDTVLSTPSEFINSLSPFMLKFFHFFTGWNGINVIGIGFILFIIYFIVQSAYIYGWKVFISGSFVRQFVDFFQSTYMRHFLITIMVFSAVALGLSATLSNSVSVAATNILAWVAIIAVMLNAVGVVLSIKIKKSESEKGAKTHGLIILVITGVLLVFFLLFIGQFTLLKKEAIDMLAKIKN